MKRLIFTLFLGGLLNALPVFAAPEPWQALSPAEKIALSPIYPQWSGLPEQQQHNLRRLAQHYADLTPDGKRRFQSRLVTWARLTPAQRQAAREKYRAFSQLPAEKREQVKQLVRQRQISPPAASAVISAPVISPANTQAQSTSFNQP